MPSSRRDCECLLTGEVSVQGQRAVLPVLVLALALVAGGTYWLRTSPGDKPDGGPTARPSGHGPGSENGNGNGTHPSSSSSMTRPSSSAPLSRPNPLSPPGTDAPLEGRYAEVAKGLSGEAAQLAIRMEEAFTNPDRRCVTRIRGEMIRMARTNPSVLVDLAKASSIPRHRSWALRILGEARAAEARGVALVDLDDPVDYVRANAAWVLGEVGTREDLPALEALSGRADEPESVRKEALNATTAILGR